MIDQTHDCTRSINQHQSHLLQCHSAKKLLQMKYGIEIGSVLLYKLDLWIVLLHALTMLSTSLIL